MLRTEIKFSSCFVWWHQAIQIQPVHQVLRRTFAHPRSELNESDHFLDQSAE